MMKLRSKVIFTWVVAVAALLVLAKAPAIAQDATGSMGHSSSGYSGAPGNTANPVAPATVDDATLKRAARAYVKVRRISDDERGAINGASNDANRQNIEQQAESKKIEAVKAEGLQPQQYNQVLAMVQADKGLAQRFLKYVDQTS
jgi:hypothetical protein